MMHRLRRFGLWMMALLAAALTASCRGGMGNLFDVF